MLDGQVVSESERDVSCGTYFVVWNIGHPFVSLHHTTPTMMPSYT